MKQQAFCFAGKHYVPKSKIVKSGTHKNGLKWHLCGECKEAYRRSREMDEDVLRIGEGKGQRVEMGWNGVPSDRTLRRRKRL